MGRDELAIGGQSPRAAWIPWVHEWFTYKGLRSLSSIANASRSGYWIIRCDKEIIDGHNDVWNMQAMETYAALLREAEFLRAQKPNPPKSD